MKLHHWDTEELAQALLNTEAEFDALEVLLYKKFDVDFDTFHRLIEALIEFTPITQSPLTKARYKGFVKGNYFVCKSEVLTQE